MYYIFLEVFIPDNPFIEVIDPLAKGLPQQNKFHFVRIFFIRRIFEPNVVIRLQPIIIDSWYLITFRLFNFECVSTAMKLKSESTFYSLFISNQFKFTEFDIYKGNRADFI